MGGGGGVTGEVTVSGGDDSKAGWVTVRQGR